MRSPALKYINIHTHIQRPDPDEFIVYNCILGEDEEPTGTFSAGIHPWYIDEEFPEMQPAELYVLTCDNRCVAVGECGLDKLKGPAPELQEFIFRAQIQLADSVKKPLIIHCVKRYTEVLRCLREEEFNGYFVLHGLNTHPENIKPFLPLSKACFSFGTALLQPGSNAEKLFRDLPPERCFLETDDGSAGIKNVYFRAAEIKGITVDELMTQILHNYKKVFVHGMDGRQ